MCVFVGVCAYWGYCCCYCQHYKLITNWAEFKSRQAELSALIPQAAMKQRLNKSSKIDCSFRCWQHNCFCCVKTPSRIQTNTHMHTHLQWTNIAHAHTHTHTHMNMRYVCLFPHSNNWFLASQDCRNVFQVFRAPEASRPWRISWIWFHAGGHFWQRDEHKAGALSNSTSDTVLGGFLR